MISNLESVWKAKKDSDFTLRQLEEHRSEDAAMDVTVVNPLQARMIDQAAVHAGHSLTVRFNDKMSKHGEACRREGMVFIPLVVETLGMGGESRHPDQEAGSCSCQADLTERVRQDQTCVPEPGWTPVQG